MKRTRQRTCLLIDGYEDKRQVQAKVHNARDGSGDAGLGEECAQHKSHHDARDGRHFQVEEDDNGVAKGKHFSATEHQRQEKDSSRQRGQGRDEPADPVDQF